MTWPFAAECGSVLEGLLQLADLGYPPGVPSTFELAGHERGDARQRYFLADDPATHGEDVGIVVFAAKAGRHWVGRFHTSDATDLVGHDLFARATAAQHDAQPAVPASDRPGRRGDDIGVIHGCAGIGAEVDRLMASIFQPLDDGPLQGEPGMIGG